MRKKGMERKQCPLGALERDRKGTSVKELALSLDTTTISHLEPQSLPSLPITSTLALPAAVYLSCSN